MSRIGKLPITLPTGVSVTLNSGLCVVKGSKGELSQKIHPDITFDIAGNIVTVKRPTDLKHHRAMHGLYRTLVFNMVKGVSEGFTTRLEMVGVGYRSEAKGQMLELNLGYSHDVFMELPIEIKVETQSEKGKNPVIILNCSDKQLLGYVAAKIRSLRKPEPYKGKGIRYSGEVVRRKAGKSAGSK